MRMHIDLFFYNFRKTDISVCANELFLCLFINLRHKSISPLKSKAVLIIKENGMHAYEFISMYMQNTTKSHSRDTVISLKYC